MNKKGLSGIMLVMFMIGMSALAFEIQPVKASPSTIHVDDDNVSGPWDGSPEHPYQNITSGLEHAIAGDTVFVRNGTYNENIAVNKSLTLLGENRDTTIIDGGGGYVIVVDITANNVVIREFTVNASTKMGIQSYGYNNGVIQDNKIIDCGDWAIRLFNSDSNNITGNIITSTQAPIGENAQHLDGVLLVYSNNNTIQENIISNLADLGIGCAESSNNTIRDNEITQIFGRTIGEGLYEKNYGFGIQLDMNSHNNSMISNNITNIDLRSVSINGTSLYNIVRDNNIFNGSKGIYLHNTSNNTISGNNITENDYGINLISSSNNSIYHNNFVNNSIQASVNGSTNVWDGGYPSGGNYWSDYTGIDKKKGPNQDQPGSDGIGDTPYTVDVNNSDRYPFMVPIPRGPKRNLVVRTLTIGTEIEIEYVKIWMENETEPTYYSPANLTVAIGNHTVKVEPLFFRVEGYYAYKYTFRIWENNSTDNPRGISVQEDMTIKAYYRKELLPIQPQIEEN